VVQLFFVLVVFFIYGCMLLLGTMAEIRCTKGEYREYVNDPAAYRKKVEESKKK
jgi:hypothetical protein